MEFILGIIKMIWDWVIDDIVFGIFFAISDLFMGDKKKHKR